MHSFESSAVHSARSKVAVTAMVLAVHALALWGLQRLPGATPAPMVIPAQVIATFITPEPEPIVMPEPIPLAPPEPVVQPKPVPKPQPKPQPKPKPQPLPKAVASPDPAPATAPTGTLDPEPTAPATPTPAPTAAQASATTDAPAAIVMPSSSAAYLNNPRPSYPSISRRMGEQGKVMLRVFVNAQGQPEQIQIQQSSGFDRLDKAAVDAVRRWKFTPGSRNGVAEAMWNIVPINFVLE